MSLLLSNKSHGTSVEDTSNNNNSTYLSSSKTSRRSSRLLKRRRTNSSRRLPRKPNNPRSNPRKNNNNLKRSTTADATMANTESITEDINLLKIMRTWVKTSNKALAPDKSLSGSNSKIRPSSTKIDTSKSVACALFASSSS